MKRSMSSRLKPKVIWVRSLVPNEKNSASAAISSAISAARGSSIIVPIWYSTLAPGSFITRLRGRDDDVAQEVELRAVATSGIMISGRTGLPFFLAAMARLDDGAHLHLGDLGVADRRAGSRGSPASG